MFRRLRVLLPALAGVLIAAGTLAFAADVLSQFRLTEEDAREDVFNTAWAARPSAFGAAGSIFRTLSPDARAAAVTGAAAFVRSYCESDAFREKYAAMRQANRPVDITMKTQSASDMDKQAARSDKAMADMQEAMKNMPPEMRKMAEAAMKEAGMTGTLDEQLEQSKKISKEGAAQAKAANAKASERLAQHQLSQKEFDATYPANPERFLAGRLREFLALTASVPFDAPMRTRGSTRYFVDPELEKKPEYWKQLYRAGRPSVDAARTAATAWLATLEGR